MQLKQHTNNMNDNKNTENLDIFLYFQNILVQELTKIAQKQAWYDGADFSRIIVEPPRDLSHGDMATNAALVMAKSAGKKPRELAEDIKKILNNISDIASVEIAGPGFVNFRLNAKTWHKILTKILNIGVTFGENNLGRGEKINIEYVSANPTGPMHVGHVRGAIIGDTLAHLLEKVGFAITREYYFNDAGTQVDVLAKTVHLRYLEVLGDDIGEVPEGLYPGEYLKDVAEALAKQDGDKWKDRQEEEWLPAIRDFAVEYIMQMIRTDLDLIGIKHDIFTNERDIVENGTLDTAFNTLENMDLIYEGTLPPPKGKEMENWEPVPLTLFRASKFGNQPDRPLKKRDGSWAYIMPDIAYHYDKIKRGFNKMIVVLGKDHSGYEERLKPVVEVFSDGKAELDVIYNSIVKVYKNGELVRFSKRSGNIITLREMVEEVGADVIRFFMMTRTPDSELEFDFDKVVEKSKDNPVFYVQYAHARCCSVLRNAKDIMPDIDISDDALANADISVLTSTDDLEIIRMLASWPRVIRAAAEAYEPHRISFYLQDLAALLHGFWAKGREDASLRFIIEDNVELSIARLTLVRAVAIVIASGLAIMGVKPVEEMHA